MTGTVVPFPSPTWQGRGAAGGQVACLLASQGPPGVAFPVAAQAAPRLAPVLVFPLLGQPPPDDDGERSGHEWEGGRREEPHQDEEWPYDILAMCGMIVVLWFLIYRGLRWVWVAWTAVHGAP